MARPTKFIPGPVITDTVHALRLILEGRWLYQGNKPQSPAWSIWWSVRLLDRHVRAKRIREAIPNPAYPWKETAE